MEKLKEVVIEFNKKEITYDLELHNHNSDLYSKTVCRLLTSEKRKHFNTCIMVTTFKDMPQNRYLHFASISTEEYFKSRGILVITPTSTIKIFKHQIR